MEYSWYVATRFLDSDGIEYDIDHGYFLLTVNPSYYATSIASDKTKVEETGATVEMKFILEEDFHWKTDLFKMSVPPINKDYQLFSGLTPIHSPAADSPPGTTIVSKLKYTED